MRNNQLQNSLQLIQERNANPYLFKENEQKNFIESNDTSKYKSLEYLLSIPQIIYSDNDNEKDSKKNFSIIDFVKANLNNLKEDLIYYFSSPESLSHFISSLGEEINYEFHKDIDFQNFITIQKERFKIIISNSKLELNTKMKISKLSNFNNSFCSKVSIIKENELLHGKMVNLNKIEIKMDECSFLYSHQEIDEEKIINYLNELKDVFIINIIDMESLGYLQFNLLEKNLILILKLIESKLLLKKNIKKLTAFPFI